MTNREFQGRVALVVGGGSGMGRTTALAFSRRGARVAVADRARSEGERTTEEIERSGGEALFLPVDIAEAAQVEAMIDGVTDRWGRVDCAANVAAILGPAKALAEIDEGEWDTLMGVNLKGIWLCLKHQIAQMLRQALRGETRGAIVNFGSISGVRARPKLAGYVASKHGVLGLTKAAALEYSARGIRVNAVCPGAILTPMLEENLAEDPEAAGVMARQHPVGRFGRPEEVAAAVLYLCSDEASFVHGHALHVDGGWNVQ